MSDTQPDNFHEQYRYALSGIFGKGHREYLEWLMAMKPLRFILVFSLHLFVLKVLVSLTIEVLTLPFPDWETSGTVNPAKIIAEKGYGYAFAFGVIAAPLGETLLGQWLPIRITRIFTSRPAILLWVSTFIFAIQHLHAGFSGLAVGVGGGVVLAFAFLTHYPNGLKPAFWITTAIHALHNGVAFLLALLVL